MTLYQSTIPDSVRPEFDFVAQHLTGKRLAEVATVLTDHRYNYPYSSLPRGFMCQFDVPDIGLSVLLAAHTDWNTEGWVDMLYLRPIGYDYAPWRFGSGSIGDSEWIDRCVKQASELYHKPEYRADWLKHTTYDK